MQLKRFQAATMAEAYRRVRQTLGDDAMIVSTRSSDAAPPDSDERVEVVAGLPEGALPLERAELAAGQAIAPHDALSGVAAAGESELGPPFANPMAGSARGGPFDAVQRALQGDAGADAVAMPIDHDTTSSDGDGELIRSIAADLADVKGLLERASLERVNARVEDGPAALQDARSRLIDQGVGPSVRIRVLDQVADAAVDGATPQMLLRTLERKLAAALPAPVKLDLGRPPLALFIVGAGGSGKTTLAVRLALELAGARGARVTLASIDVNRAGAPQQLTACGAAAGLAVRVCYAPGELKGLLAEGSADVVVIDTPANNGLRRDRMAELNAFAQVTHSRATLLVLPAVAKTDDVLRTSAAYAESGIDGLVLTRCDETATFGGLLTAACERETGIAYSTHGEGIGDALREGDNHALALAIVGGGWPQAADVRGMAASTG